MDIKPQPNRRRYLEVLKRMGGPARMAKAFELTEMVKNNFRLGLRRRFPDASDAELQKIYLERLAKCHNKNY